jgi:hypothetical protein
MGVLLDSSSGRVSLKKEEPDEGEGMTGEELARRWAVCATSHGKFPARRCLIWQVQPHIKIFPQFQFHFYFTASTFFIFSFSPFLLFLFSSCDQSTFLHFGLKHEN